MHPDYPSTFPSPSKSISPYLMPAHLSIGLNTMATCPGNVSKAGKATLMSNQSFASLHAHISSPPILSHSCHHIKVHRFYQNTSTYPSMESQCWPSYQNGWAPSHNGGSTFRKLVIAATPCCIGLLSRRVVLVIARTLSRIRRTTTFAFSIPLSNLWLPLLL